MNRTSQKKTFIATTEDISVLAPLVINKTIEMFKSVGVDITASNISFEGGDNEQRLYIDFFDNRPPQTEEERTLLQAAIDLGFTETGYENLRIVLELIYEAHLDHSLDDASSCLILEFYNESKEIMHKVNKLYTDIDNMTAEEAKQAVAGLYTHLKNNYGWRE